MSFSKITETRIYLLAHDTFADWMEDNALRLSAALAYYSVFSIAPLLVIAISIAGWALGPEAVTGQLDNQLRGYVGSQAAEAVQTMVKSAAKPSDSAIGGMIGFATLLLGAAGIFGQLKDALNTIWEVKAKGDVGVWGFLRQRLLNFGMVLVIGFLLLISLLLSIVVKAASGYLNNVLHLPVVLWSAVGVLLSFMMVTVLFATIFKVLPDAKIDWRNVWIGAALTAVLFELGKLGLSWYLGRESTVSSYGAAGSLVLLLLWVYYASCILLLGAEFTRVYAKASGQAIQPGIYAVAVTRESRAQQGLVPLSDISKEEPVVKKIVQPAPQRPTPPELAHSFFAMLATGFFLGLITRKKPEN